MVFTEREDHSIVKGLSNWLSIEGPSEALGRKKRVLIHFAAAINISSTTSLSFRGPLVNRTHVDKAECALMVAKVQPGPLVLTIQEDTVIDLAGQVPLKVRCLLESARKSGSSPAGGGAMCASAAQ